jgi:hypothetical protein
VTVCSLGVSGGRDTVSASHRLLNAAGKNTIGCNGSLDINMSYKAICTEKVPQRAGWHGKKSARPPSLQLDQPVEISHERGWPQISVGRPRADAK